MPLYLNFIRENTQRLSHGVLKYFVFDTSSRNNTRLMNVWNYINPCILENTSHPQKVRPYTKTLIQNNKLLSVWCNHTLKNNSKGKNLNIVMWLTSIKIKKPGNKEHIKTMKY